MSTPSRRLSGASYFTNSGPSRSVLQKLLEEINGSETPTAPRDVDTPQVTPRPRSDSVWVAGGSMAEDARCKLRAADEARQRKLAENNTNGLSSNETPSQPRRHSTQFGMQPRASTSGTTIWKVPRSSTFKEVEFGGLTASTTANTTSPRSGSRESICRRFLEAWAPG